MAREFIKIKRNNVTISNQKTDLRAKLIETRATERTMRSQNIAAKIRIKPIKAQLNDAQMTLEKLTDELTMTKADLCAEVVPIEKSLEAEKACVESLQLKLANEFEEKQQFLAERRETSQKASRPMIECEDPLPDPQSKLAAMAAGRDESFDLTTERTEKVKAAEGNIALQLTLWEAVHNNTVTYMVEIVELHEHLRAKRAELSQLSGSNSDPIDVLFRVKSQRAAGSTVFNGQKWVAGNCVRHIKRVEVAHQSREPSATPSMVTFSSLLAEGEE